MNFLYEATDASGKTVHGKTEGATLAEAQLKLLRQGLRPVTVAPIPDSVASTPPISAPSSPIPSANVARSASPPTARPPSAPVVPDHRTLDVSTARSSSSVLAEEPIVGLATGQSAPRTAGGGLVLLDESASSAATSVQTLPPLPLNTSSTPVVNSRTLSTAGDAMNARSLPALNSVNVSSAPLATNAAGSAALSRTGTRTGGIIMAGNAAKLATQTSGNKTQAGAIANAALAPMTARTTRRVLTPVPANASRMGGVSTRDLMFFFRQMGQLTHSGMTLFAALENLGNRTRNANLAQTVREMAEAARNGKSVSDVMANYPRIYPENVVGMVRAGETGGFVEIAFAEVADAHEANIALYRQAWIPKLMATQAFFMFALVQPLFPTLFPGANFALYLKLVFLRNLPITFALYLLIRFASKTLQLPQYRHLRDGWALKMPPFGELQRLSALTTFLRALRRLYGAGVGPGAAWEGAMHTASNIVIRDRLAAAADAMQSGTSFPDAFARTGLFGDNVEQLILTGQASGTVVESLDQAANYYSAQLGEATGKTRFMMLRLGILAMLILGGGTMLWMVKTYFKSIFDFADNFEKG